MPERTDPKPEVTIYTDGGSEPNPGKGGWGAVLLYENATGRHEKEISGAANNATNNRMEIMAMLEALKALKRPCHVLVITDSEYLKYAVGRWRDGAPSKPPGWIATWHKLGWRRHKGALKNVDLWQEMWELCARQKSIKMKWVRAHDGDHYNERCHDLATIARCGLE